MKIAITGGIGSGKSYFCHTLEAMGISVYDCDEAAKRLLHQDRNLQHALSGLVGKPLFTNGHFHKSELARYLLASDEHKAAVNDIVHPAVAADFLNSGYSWLESAILFDSGFDKRVHFSRTVCVTAPLEVRIERVMERDGISREKTLEWIGRQMGEEEVRSRCDFVIVNDGRQNLKEQAMKLINQINNNK